MVLTRLQLRSTAEVFDLQVRMLREGGATTAESCAAGEGKTITGFVAGRSLSGGGVDIVDLGLSLPQEGWPWGTPVSLVELESRGGWFQVGVLFARPYESERWWRVLGKAPGTLTVWRSEDHSRPPGGSAATNYLPKRYTVELEGTLSRDTGDGGDPADLMDVQLVGFFFPLRLF